MSSVIYDFIVFLAFFLLIKSTQTMLTCEWVSLYDGEVPYAKDLLAVITSGLKLTFGGLKESGSE